MKRRLKITFGICTVLFLMFLYVWNSGKDARPAIGESKILEYSGIKVHYYEYGEGDTVVLLAGMGRSVSDFNELVEFLSKSRFRTVAVELKGIGESTGSGFFKKIKLHDYANDVAEVIKKLHKFKNEKVHIVGHALGNRIARTLATNYPELIKSVTLIAAGGYVPISKDIKRAMLVIPLSFLPDRIRKKNIRKALFASGNDIPDCWISGWHFRAMWVQRKAALSTPREEWWSGGQAPILLLQAENDVIAPIGNVEAMKKELGNRLTVVMIPKAGHAMLAEQPELIRKAMILFLRKH